MKAKKLEFEEISKDQILVEDETALSMIKKVKHNEIESYLAVGLSILLIYLWKPTWLGIIIMVIIGGAVFNVLDKAKEKWEEKVMDYYMTKKATNPDYNYIDEDSAK